MSLTNAFDEALARFKKELTPKEIADFTATSIEDCWSEAKRIEEDQAKRRSLRNMRRIQPYLDSLAQFSKVIEVFVQAKPEVMSFIWGPIKFLIQVASTYTASLDKLLDAFTKISESLPRFVNYADIFQRIPRMTHILSLIYEDILVFHRSTMKFFGKRGWQQMFIVLWKTFEDSFGTTLRNLERHRVLVDVEATAAHIGATAAHIEAMAAHIAAADQERKAAIYADKQREKDRRIRCMRELREWLVPVLYETEKNNFTNIRKSCPGTGDWLLQDDKFKAWLDPSSQIQFLWLTGIPGSGKTILSSLVTDHTKLQSQGANSAAFAFLKNGSHEHNSCLAVIRTLVYQLLVQNQDLIPYIYQAYESSNFNSPTSLEQVEDLFQIMIGNIAFPYLIIDGLDEIKPIEGKSVLSSLLSIQSKNANLKIFLSSRFEVGISKILSIFPQIKIGEANMKDIFTYTNMEGRQLVEKFADTDPETRKEIEGMVQQVGNRAHGMFLWVRLVIYNLMQQTNLEELESAVQDLPEGLEEAYGRILKRIDGQLGPNERDLARRILEWVICANRPLKIREVKFALAIRKGDRTFVKKRKFLGRLDELCGPILEIDDNGVVDFVHFSAKEYLISEYSGRHLIDTYNGPFINISTAHFNIAQTCLFYLSFACFDATLDNSEITGYIYNGDYCLEDYAEGNWLHHVRHANNCSVGQLQDLSSTLKTFIQSQRNQSYQQPSTNLVIQYFSKFRDIHLDVYTNLVMIYEFQNSQNGSLLDHDDKKHPLQLQSIIARVRENLEALVLSLTGSLGSEGEKSLQIIRDFYGSKLFKCRQRTCTRFRIGFEKSEDRDKHAKKHTRAFKCRVHTCPSHSIGFETEQALEKHHNDHHKEMVTPNATNILVEIPEIIEDPGTFTSILKDAIDTDNVALLDWALTQETVIEEEKFGKYGMVGYALSRGFKSTNTARALIEKGVQIRPLPRVWVKSALLIASSSKFYDISIIRLLVEKGENVSEHDSRGLSPLDYSVLNRSHVGVTYLMGIANVWQKGDSLYLALTKGYFDISKLLSDHGARMPEFKAGYALVTAVKEARKPDELKIILMNSTDEENRTKALTMAWDDGLWDAAELLLAYGTLAPPVVAGAALVAAVREARKPQELRMILAHGTYIEDRGKALAAAWESGLWDIAKLLLDHGARTSTATASDALIAAVGECQGLEDIRAILKHGVDVDGFVKALNIARESGLSDIALQNILKYDPSKEELTGSLAVAWGSGMWDAAELLLAHGVRASPVAAGNALLLAIELGRETKEIEAILRHGITSESKVKALEIIRDTSGSPGGRNLWGIVRLLIASDLYYADNRF